MQALNTPNPRLKYSVYGSYCINHPSFVCQIIIENFTQKQKIIFIISLKLFI